MNNQIKIVKSSFDYPPIHSVFSKIQHHKQKDLLYVVNETKRENIVNNINCYPYNCICKLIITNKNKDKFIGTGYFMAENVIFTAAHCIYDILTKDAYHIEAYVQIKSRQYCDPPEWRMHDIEKTFVSKYYKNSNNDKYDYGIIITKTKSEKFIPMVMFDDLTESSKINPCYDYCGLVIGYSSDRIDYLVGMAKSNFLIDVNSKNLLHCLNADGGQSGSPILLLEKKFQKDKFKLDCSLISHSVVGSIGVHGGVHSYYNCGIYFNEEFINELNEWRNEYIQLETISKISYHHTHINTPKSNRNCYNDISENCQKNKLKSLVNQNNGHNNHYKFDTRGEYENNSHICNGKGKYSYINGNISESEVANGIIKGKGIYTFENGDCYKGDLANDKMHGKGKYTWASGSIYEGDFMNDIIHGKGKRKFDNGNVYDGEWVNGMMQGKGVYRFANGDVYEGNFMNDNFHGKGEIKYNNGDIYKGEWANGSIQGKGIYKFANGDIYEGYFMNDKKHGKGKYKWANGVIYEGVFMNGEIYGEEKYTHDNGTLNQENLVNQY